MAEEKKTVAKTKKPPAAKAAPAASAAPPKVAKAKASKGDVSARSRATPAAPEGARCTVAGCKQPLRAHAMCRKHYMGWRRGVVGTAHRYKICSKEACRKPREFGGFCAEHAGKAAPAGDAPAPAAA
jgi:hypothetical protein